MHIAAAETATHKLLPALDLLERELSRKSREFHDVIKIGRTHLQDAVPMRLGQEFSGYAAQVHNAKLRIARAIEALYELPLGGTAVGTGLNAPTGFASETISEIARMTGLPFVEAQNHFEAQAAKDAVVFLSGALRGCAVALTKIANDIRWLASGPRSGLGEIKVPAVQPGSSIMPGKVNPVIAESLLMVCAQVIGYDATIAWCGAAGNFELNVMMPVMAWDIIESITLLANASRNFEHRLLAGTEADRARAMGFVEQSLAMGTALAPAIGYDAAAALVKNAYLTGRTVREVALEQSGLPKQRVEQLLDPESQAG
jgi:fumarate hydratase class II